jgi:hypothetical protein
MDTTEVRDQLAYVAEEVERQSALAGNRFKFFINKRLIDYFGNREVAYKRTSVALAILEDKLKLIKVTNSYYVELEYDEVDRYDRAWFAIKLTDKFHSEPDGSSRSDKPIFKARTGILYINGQTISFEPKTRKAIILSLCLHRPKTSVGFERISSAYEKIDSAVMLTDKQIRDDVLQINKKITATLPEVTEFLSAKNSKVRVV